MTPKGCQEHGPRAPAAPAHGAPLCPSSLIAGSGPGPINCTETAKPRARAGTTTTAWGHNPRPWPRQAPGLPRLLPEPFAFPLPPPFRPGCHHPQLCPLPGREAAACAGAPPSPHPPGQRRAPAGTESRARPPPALPRSVPAERGFPRRFRPALPGPAAPSRGAAGRCARGLAPRCRPWSCRSLTGTALQAHRSTGSDGLGKTWDIIQFNI